MGEQVGQNEEKVGVQGQVSTNNTITSSTTSTPTYCCDVCGKCFETIHQLRGHCASTGHPFPDRYRKKEEEVKPMLKTRKKVEEEEQGIPDPYEHLSQMLKAFGVRDKDVTAIITFMRNYDVDNLHKLTEVLREYMPRTKLRLFLEAWANVRGLRIPYSLRKEFGLTPSTPTYIPPRRTPTTILEDPEVREALMLLEQKGIRTDVLLTQQRGNGYEPGIFSLLKTLIDKLVPSPSPSSSDNTAIQSLIQENQRLRERLEKLESELEKRKLIEPLEKEIQEVKSRLEKISTSTDAQVEFVKGIFDLAREGIGIYKTVVERVVRVKPEERPPQRKVVGSPDSIQDLIKQMGGEVE